MAGDHTIMPRVGGGGGGGGGGQYLSQQACTCSKHSHTTDISTCILWCGSDHIPELSVLEYAQLSEESERCDSTEIHCRAPYIIIDVHQNITGGLQQFKLSHYLSTYMVYNFSLPAPSVTTSPTPPPLAISGNKFQVQGMK